MGRFNGKIVLVTGGNRNTGIDLVEKFAREGARVFMCGSSEASAAKGSAELKARGLDGITSQTCNIADLGQVTALFDTIEREAGRLDILVNNAANQGLGHGGPLEMDPSKFHDVFNVNVIGGFQVTQMACNRFAFRQLAARFYVHQRLSRARSLRALGRSARYAL